MPRLATLFAPLLFVSIGAASCSSSSASDAGPAKPVLPTHPTAAQNAAADALLTGPDWYRHAIFYEIDVRSFADSNGDGIGDLAGVVSRLDYLKDLGVDALWLMPTFPSPFKDSGYDIADYRDVDPAYGDLAAMDRLVAEAHARKMRVFLDLVLNHTSDKHAWFTESRSSKDNAKAGWYVWSDTPSRADIGNCKPDNPRFGDAWTLDPTRNQYYFHRYYPQQPDLDYRSPDVVAATLDVARFWLGKGVDGFRCDVIGKLYESPAGCDMIPETVAYIQKLRGVLDEAPNHAMVAEPSDLSDSSPYFGDGKDMFHMTFDFGFGYFWYLSFSSSSKTLIESALQKTAGYVAGAQAAQVIGSHDVPRAWQASGGNAWRIKNAMVIQMTTKGTPFVYYGDEVGLRPGTQIVVDDRDYARTPMTWTKADPGHGFTTGQPWIGFGDAPELTSVDAEDAEPESMLSFTRRLLAFRRGNAIWGTGALRVVALDSTQIVAFVREDASHTYFVAVNVGEDEASGATSDALPGAGTLVFGDGALTVSGGRVEVKLPGEGAAIFQVR